MKKSWLRSWNLLDAFLVFLMLLAGLAFYFNFVRPIQFSHLIKREGVIRYGNVDFLLPDELAWMKDVLPVGEESRNVYGELDWKILELTEETLGGRRWVKVKAKILVAEESSGLLRYGKYTLVRGGKIFLINDHYFLEGRILDYGLLKEGIQL